MINLRETFSDFNKRYFGGRLPACTVKWSSTIGKAHNGMFSDFGDDLYMIEIGSWLKSYGKFSRMVLLHEMVHLEQAANKQPTRHGPRFHKRMKELAAEGAFNNSW